MIMIAVATIYCACFVNCILDIIRQNTMMIRTTAGPTNLQGNCRNVKVFLNILKFIKYALGNKLVEINKRVHAIPNSECKNLLLLSDVLFKYIKMLIAKKQKIIGKPNECGLTVESISEVPNK